MPGNVDTPSQGEQRRVLALTALVIAASLPIDVLVAGKFLPDALFTRLVWAGTVLVLGLLSPWLERAHGGFVYAVLGASAPFFFGAIVLATGDIGGPQFYWLVALPPVTSALVHHRIRAVVLASVGTTVVGTLLFWVAGRPSGQLVLWAFLALSSGILASYGSYTYLRLQRRQDRLITERLDAMASLAQSESARALSERLALVGKLAAGVAHEINNPLAFSLANMEFIRSEVAEDTRDPEVSQAFNETIIGLKRIAQIVADLKSFAREGTELPSPCEVAVVVDTASRIALVRLKTLARIEISIEPALPKVLMGDHKLCQVLVNLLVNAADSFEENGTRDAMVRIRAERDGDFVLLAIEDNGPGMPAEVLARLFAPFFTTKQPGKGTGLGLAISREFVEMVGGTLSAGNRAGGGAIFTLRLPAGLAPETRKGAVRSPPS